MITDDIRDAMDRAVLCWLASVNADGAPNVSPKEVFAAVSDSELAIAHIASPQSVKNILANPKVCVSVVDVLSQRGFKLLGHARVLKASDEDYARVVAPLEKIAGPVFRIHAVIVVNVTAAEPIIAPSYRLQSPPSEAHMRESARKRYGF
jgi:uncharacterized protein